MLVRYEYRHLNAIYPDTVSMSKSPVPPATHKLPLQPDKMDSNVNSSVVSGVIPGVDTSLMQLLESSLEVQCLDAGSNPSVIKPMPHQYPYTLIGQCVESAMIIRTAQGRPIHIEPAGGYILPEGQWFNVGATSDQPAMYHWSHLRFRVLGNLDLFDIVQSPYGVSPRHGRQFALLNQQLAKQFNKSPSKAHQQTGHDMLQQIAKRKLAAAQMLSLVLELCPMTPGAMQKLALLSRFQSVIVFIEENLDRPIFRDELADVAGLSPSRFHAAFLDATSQSPMAYVTHLRLHKAQELLLGTADAIQTIAQNVGFRDPFHFSRTFSKHLGQSPSQYRQRGRMGWMNEEK